MKWGDRNEQGCSDADCSKVHPLLCDKSLDLKCLAKSCPFKLHTIKCQRLKSAPTKDFSGGGTRERLGSQHQRRVPVNPWQSSGQSGQASKAATGRGQAGGGASRQKSSSDNQNNQNFQKMTVQPQLDAYMTMMRQELWEEVRVLRSFLAREIQLAQQVGPRPSY